MHRTKIPWATHTWNPVTGCTKISEGCLNCYAHTWAQRFNAGRFSVMYHPERLDEPKKLRKPAKIFVCSMSDLFHDNVTREQHEEIFAVMKNLPQHTFMLLTKRPKRMREAFGGRRVPDNVWLGVTAENGDRWEERVNVLREIDARIHFVSCEPLLEPIIMLPAYHVEWVIAGPETGAGARPCRMAWIRGLADQCSVFKILFFDKSSYAVRREFPV